MFETDRRTFVKRTGAAAAVGAVYAQSARATTEDPDVGTLGPSGSYSHRAARRVSDRVGFYDTMFDVADAVEAGEVPAGVLPIENSIQGAVLDTLEIVRERDLFLTGETTTEIRHALMSQSAAIETIASHPQALAQSNAYLDAQYPDAERREVDSTSRGVEIAAEDSSVGAIAHPDLAPAFDLELIASDIQNVDDNVTRFVRLETEPTNRCGGKTTVLVDPGEAAVGLPTAVMGTFVDAGVDPTRLEARPATTGLGGYVYHVDFEHRSPEAIVRRLRTVTAETRYLGTYETL
ncbi:prephenate dehydratase (plasmid) [Haloferacaceae archaeon DSL9]